MQKRKQQPMSDRKSRELPKPSEIKLPILRADLAFTNRPKPSRDENDMSIEEVTEFIENVHLT